MKSEAKILKFIRYAPIFFLLLISILIIGLISFNHYKNLETEKKFFKEHYYDAEKERIDELIDILHKYILTQESSKEKLLKEQLKNYVDNAHKIMTSIYEKNKNIKSKDQIINEISDVLRNLNYYGGRGYYFIYNFDGLNILNAQFPELEGKNLWNYKDAKGVYLLQEMKSILSTKQSTYYDWYWKKLDKETTSKKIGYFKKFEPYNLFIGMGEYTDDFDEKLKEEIITYIRKLKSERGEYIFLINKDNKVLVNGENYILNSNFIDNKNIRISKVNLDKYLNIRTREKKSDFITYDVLNKETNKFETKTSYLKWFDKWEWYIGTGFKNHTIDKLIEKREFQIESVYKSNINNIIFTSIAVIIILLIVSIIVTRYLERSFKKYKENINKSKLKLLKAQEIAAMGDWEYCLIDKKMYWSQEIFKILNIQTKPKKFSRNFINSLIHEEDLAKFNKAVHDTIKYGTRVDSIYRVYDSSMQIRYINFKSEKISDIKLVGIIQDVTARVNSEIEKEKKEKMLFQQSKLAAMGEMIGNIAHQWRQPLSTISTVCTGIKVQKEHSILKDEDLLNGMNTINNATQYLSNTIDDFRNFFEPKKDKLSRFNISETFTKTLKLISPQFMNRNIRIHENILSIEINSLENELVQVFINILNNAKDALQLKKPQEKHIFINVKDFNNKVKIEIYDNAGGIKPQNIDRIFEPYFTTKHKSQGTGIGLYMSREIIETLIKGQISVCNYEFKYNDEVYTGAKFTIIFEKDGEKIT